MTSEERWKLKQTKEVQIEQLVGKKITDIYMDSESDWQKEGNIVICCDDGKAYLIRNDLNDQAPCMFERDDGTYYYEEPRMQLRTKDIKKLIGSKVLDVEEVSIGGCNFENHIKTDCGDMIFSFWIADPEFEEELYHAADPFTVETLVFEVDAIS